MKLNRKKINRVARKYNLDFVVLHGSEARKELKGPESDVDIAVYRRGGIPAEEYLDLYSEMAGCVKEGQADIKSLSNKNSLFLYQVLRDGELLFGNKTDYNDFEAYVYKRMVESKPLLDLESDLIDKYQRELRSD